MHDRSKTLCDTRNMKTQPHTHLKHTTGRQEPEASGTMTPHAQLGMA
jgi:hypothetical protein